MTNYHLQNFPTTIPIQKLLEIVLLINKIKKIKKDNKSTFNLKSIFENLFVKKKLDKTKLENKNNEENQKT